MATALHNILRFTGLVIGVPAALPHRLNANGIAVIPRLIAADGAGYTITADTVNVTVTRGATAAAAVSVYVEYWHTIENAQPLPGGIATSLFPFVVQGGGTAGGGGGITALSGGTTNATGPGISFANGGNVTFGINGNTITASVQTAGGTATGVGISAGTESAATGAVVFSNSNNVSFGMNSSTVTASFSASIQPNPAISAAGASASNGTIVWSNSNNVSFGMAGSTITASVAAAGETPFGISAGSQSVSTGTLAFANSNGVTFGMAGSSQVTASVSSVVFSNSNNISFGLNGATLTATVAGGGETPFGISAGSQSVSTGTMIFANSNGLAFGMSGSSQITGSYSTLSFSNLNGVSFGIVGSTITASIAAATDSGVAIAASGSTRSTGTVLFTSHASLGNNVSFAYTNNSQIVASAGIALGAPNGGTGGNFMQLDFNNGNGVSFGRAGATITASVAAGGGIALAGAGGTITNGTASLVNANGVFWSVNGQSVSVARVATVSGTAGENVRVLASTANISISNASGNIAILAPDNGNSEGITISAGQRISILGGDRVDLVGTIVANLGGAQVNVQATNDVNLVGANVAVQLNSTGTIGFFNVAGTNRRTVTGASTNATLLINQLLAILGSHGLISNNATT